MHRAAAVLRRARVVRRRYNHHSRRTAALCGQRAELFQPRHTGAGTCTNTGKRVPLLASVENVSS